MATILNQIGQFIGSKIKQTRDYVDTQDAATLSAALTTLRGNVPVDGDTLEKLYGIVSGAGGVAALRATTTFPGELSLDSDNPRWYPSRGVTFTKLHAFLSELPDQDITFEVYVSGVLQNSYTLTATDFTNVWDVSIALTVEDYLQVVLTQVGTAVKGSNLVISFLE